MTYQTFLQKSGRTIALSIFLIINTGCSSISEKQVVELDPDQVSNMQFRVESLSTVFKTPLPEEKISFQVTANLSESGFSLTKKGNSVYSHHLTVQIGSVQHSSTPVGFSFNAGNSDPRALDFQKADILPLTCSLTSRHQLEQRADLTMDFVAKRYLSDTAQSSADNRVVEKLVNDMSTVCFNLLSNLQVKRQSINQSDETVKSGWMPTIEIRNVPEPDAETATVTKIKLKSQTQKKQDNIDFPVKINQPVKTKLSDDEQQSVEIKKNSVVKQSNKKTRKQLIINNQGSPVTIQFGHERK
ncbi:MAG: hypothetical protein V3U88_05685 [Methylococcales bacterium]